jgi:hypothetical protein
LIDRLQPNRDGSLLLIQDQAMAFTLPRPTDKERDEATLESVYDIADAG